MEILDIGIAFRTVERKKETQGRTDGIDEGRRNFMRWGLQRWDQLHMRYVSAVNKG